MEYSFEDEPSEVCFEVKYLEIPEKTDGWLTPNGYYICCKNGFHDQAARYALFLYLTDQLSVGEKLISMDTLVEFTFENPSIALSRIAAIQHKFVLIKDSKLWETNNRSYFDNLANDLQKNLVEKAGLLGDLE